MTWVAMSTDEEPFSQKAGLLDDEDETQRREQAGFWRKLFRRKRKDTTEDDAIENENASLLDSCPELEYDGDQQPMLSRTASLPIGLQPINGSDSDDEESTEENPLHASAPLIHYSAHVSKADSSGDSLFDSESSGSDANDSSDEGGVELSSKPRNNPARVMAPGHRMYSVGSNYKDDPYSSGCIVQSRNSINGRIQGFGSSIPEPEMVSPKTLRRRLNNYREKRMEKMAIGEDAVGHGSWRSNIHNVVIGIVDSVLPGDIEGDSNQYKMSRSTRLPADIPKEFDRPGAEPKLKNIEPEWNKQRNEIGNDEVYILYLECELKNKDLELESWRFRVKELQQEVSRLKKSLGVSDDSSDASSSAVQDGESSDSEIEWETGIRPKEGILVDLKPEEGAERNNSEALNVQERIKVNTSYDVSGDTQNILDELVSEKTTATTPPNMNNETVADCCDNSSGDDNSGGYGKESVESDRQAD